MRRYSVRVNEGGHSVSQKQSAGVTSGEANKVDSSGVSERRLKGKKDAPNGYAIVTVSVLDPQ